METRLIIEFHQPGRVAAITIMFKVYQMPAQESTQPAYIGCKYQSRQQSFPPPLHWGRNGGLPVGMKD